MTTNTQGNLRERVLKRYWNRSFEAHFASRKALTGVSIMDRTLARFYGNMAINEGPIHSYEHILDMAYDAGKSKEESIAFKQKINDRTLTREEWKSTFSAARKKYHGTEFKYDLKAPGVYKDFASSLYADGSYQFDHLKPNMAGPYFDMYRHQSSGHRQRR